MATMKIQQDHDSQHTTCSEWTVKKTCLEIASMLFYTSLYGIAF